MAEKGTAGAAATATAQAAGGRGVSGVLIGGRLLPALGTATRLTIPAVCCCWHLLPAARLWEQSPAASAPQSLL